MQKTNTQNTNIEHNMKTLSKHTTITNYQGKRDLQSVRAKGAQTGCKGKR